MNYSKLPFYLQEKLAKANLDNASINSIDDVVELYANLKLYYPSLGTQGLYDIFNSYIGYYPNVIEKQMLSVKRKNLTPRYLPQSNELVEKYMLEAFVQAELAFANDEVPVGAVVVYNNQIIGYGYNQTKRRNSSLYHAEIVAIQDAQRHLDQELLIDCDLYVTLEPCLMCSGAIMNARIKRVYFAGYETKTGACSSQYRVFENTKVNHHTQIIGGVMQHQSSELMQKFFSQLRNCNS